MKNDEQSLETFFRLFREEGYKNKTFLNCFFYRLKPSEEQARKIGDFLFAQAEEKRKDDPLFALGCLQLFWRWAFWQGIFVEQNESWLRKYRKLIVMLGRQFLQDVPPFQPDNINKQRLVIIWPFYMNPRSSPFQVMETFLKEKRAAALKTTIFAIPYFFSFNHGHLTFFREHFIQNYREITVGSKTYPVVTLDQLPEKFQPALHAIIQKLRSLRSHYALFLGTPGTAMDVLVCLARIAPLQFSFQLGPPPFMPNLNTFFYFHSKLPQPTARAIAESRIEAIKLIPQATVGRYKKESPLEELPPKMIRRTRTMTMVTVGNYLERRLTEGYATLIATFLQRDKNAALCIIGAGQFQRLKHFFILKGVLQRVFFLGDRADIFPLLPFFQIYLNTFPLGGGFSVLEALEQGLPVLHLHQAGLIQQEGGGQYVGKFGCSSFREYDQFLKQLLKRRSIARMWGERMKLNLRRAQKQMDWTTKVADWMDSHG